MGTSAFTVSSLRKLCVLFCALFPELLLPKAYNQRSFNNTHSKTNTGKQTSQACETSAPSSNEHISVCAEPASPCVPGCAPQPAGAPWDALGGTGCSGTPNTRHGGSEGTFGVMQALLCSLQTLSLLQERCLELAHTKCSFLTVPSFLSGPNTSSWQLPRLEMQLRVSQTIICRVIRSCELLWLIPARISV